MTIHLCTMTFFLFCVCVLLLLSFLVWVSVDCWGCPVFFYYWTRWSLFFYMYYIHIPGIIIYNARWQMQKKYLTWGPPWIKRARGYVCEGSIYYYYYWSTVGLLSWKFYFYFFFFNNFYTSLCSGSIIVNIYNIIYRYIFLCTYVYISIYRSA